MAVVQKISYETIDKAGAVVMKSFDAGNFMVSFVIAGIMCLVSGLLVLIIKAPSAK